MAYASTGICTTGTRPFAGVAHFFSGLADGYARYKAYQNTLHELSSLSDRELRDAGIARHEIHAVAARAAFLAD